MAQNGVPNTGSETLPPVFLKADSVTETSKLLHKIIPYKDLEPSWHVPAAKEPGFMRWLINWVGGPEGHINTNPDTAQVSQNTVTGLMNMGVGQKQKGLHYHSVAEIYIVIKGQLEGFDGKGEKHVAGPLDCVYIPKGVPHGVRNCGSEECELIWVHSGIEKKGTSVYFMDGIYTGPPQVDEISVVNFRDLEPSYDAYRAKEIEFSRWMVNWVAGPSGYENFNRGQAVENDKVSIGMTVVQPAQKIVPHSHHTAEHYVVLKGKALINCGQGNQELGKLDGVYVPPCLEHGVRNHGEEPLYLLWVHERPQKVGTTKYR
jgi:mannose-6-phosphate isomerase-like protein (cupin superfamily)